MDAEGLPPNDGQDPRNGHHNAGGPVILLPDQDAMEEIEHQVPGSPHASLVEDAISDRCSIGN